MLIRFFRWLFARPSPKVAKTVASSAPSPSPPPTAFQALNQQAPLRQQPANPPPAESAQEELSSAIASTILCREAVLNRQQKIAGYQFLLQDATHAKIRSHSRRILHLYAEVLVDNLVRTNMATLLGSRLAFIELPDSFLTQPILGQLQASNTVIIIRSTNDTPGAPSPEALRAQVDTLRAQGYRIGIPDPVFSPPLAHLLPVVDVVCLRAPNLDAEKELRLVRYIIKQAPKATLLVRDLPGMEDFHFAFKLGASLFQGPFITSREEWQPKNLGPNFARLSMLLAKLRQDANTREIVELLKQDAAITVRLLRYINSAANGLPEHVSSIERAFVLLGRDPLYRWLTLLLCGSDRSQARSAAVLESALIRARTMELSAINRPPSEREAMFLTGLLSLIDVILQQPLDKALSSLAIAPEISAAILENQGPYAACLTLAKACESADIEAIIFAATLCGISPDQGATWHMEALAWTLALQQSEGMN
ncbi:MAG: HDOD domain-containing protein [Azoarcus sp.]|jgi:EAL and modified HD-GYP domain-containing signal transduction protein|nr:HDOD domain-containing protein [Azoarcus sp.]